MPLVNAVYVNVGNPDLPLWQVVPLTILGCAIALGLLSGVIALVGLPGRRRLGRRVQAVESAAGDSGPYGVRTVKQAVERLSAEMYSAWDAGDRDRLARISDPDLMADWNKRLDRYAADGKRQRVQVLNGPRLDYVSLMADRSLVRLRVRASLRRGFEPVNRHRLGVQKRPVGAKVAVEEFWTLSRSGNDWILCSTRPSRFRAEYTSEPIVPETAVQASAM
jgi:predicted lipid-binding transport protein (Tim44 family)